MTDREDYASRLLTQAVVINLQTKANRDTREAAKAAFVKVGQREIGELDGQDIGSVQLTKARESWVVEDPAAFQAWVEKHHPEHIVTVEQVASSFKDHVIAACKGEGMIDQETGELIIPPGIVPKRGQPILTVTPSKDAERIILRALGDAAVTLGLAERAELEA